MDALIKKRQAALLILDRIRAFLNKHGNQSEPLTAFRIQTHFDNASIVARELATMIQDAIQVVKDEDRDHQMDLFAKQVERAKDLMDCARTFLQALPLPTPAAKPVEVKLPQLELPKFNGNLSDWLPFKDLFKASVDQNTSLTDAQKLQYLKSSLTGKAANLIKSYQPTDQNYKPAWKTLEERYQNTRELVFHQCSVLFNQQSMKEDSAVSLRKLINTTNECVRALNVLQVNVSDWNTVLTWFVVSRLSPESRQDWEVNNKGGTIPTFNDCVMYLDARARALSVCVSEKKQPSRSHGGKQASSHHAASTSTSSASAKCIVCSENHLIHMCQKFRAMSVNERHTFAVRKRLCFNCLRPGHSIGDCSNTKTCKTCSKRHHTMLHKEANANGRPKQSTEPKPEVVSGHTTSNQEDSDVLLSTAIIKVLDTNGNYHSCRALLDTGSHVSFVSEGFVQRLRLRRDQAACRVTGLGGAKCGLSRGQVTLTFGPRFRSSEKHQVKAYVMPKVTSNLPLQPCQPSWTELESVSLADPEFYLPGPIDVLLGADIVPLLMTGTQIKTPGKPVAQQTVLGWVLLGPFSSTEESTAREVRTHLAMVDVDSTLEKFWELESVPSHPPYNEEEKACEDHFVSTHTRAEDGRIVVKFPFVPGCTPLGESKTTARSRWLQCERKFLRNPSICKQYHDCLQDYLDLGHMELIPPEEIEKPPGSTYYIPHHAVFKEQSTTTKLRVVFDASAKSTSGVSLNDNLMTGPTIQDDIFSIILRFRLHPVAMMADITKMYRQVLVHPSERDLQRILWRKDPSLPIREYRLSRLTFGERPAAFLAVRSLHQVAMDGMNRYPLGAESVLKDFYVDDLMSGTNTTQEALTIQQQLIDLLATGGFQLRKWISNSPAVIQAVPEEMREASSSHRIDLDESYKALGIQWFPNPDHFSFSVDLETQDHPPTKRIILSTIARLFDPIGWLAPVIISGKIFLQQLWEAKLDWDDPGLLSEILDSWENLKSQLYLLDQVRIPRCITTSSAKLTQLIGFSDASKDAYAACVYLRNVYSADEVTVHLVAAKSKVAPLKQVNIPRLELCGSQLLAQLLEAVRKALKIEAKVFAFTDSTCVLRWLAAPPKKWKTFVANRVSFIQDIIPFSQWSHVRGEFNPADVASRGTSVQNFLNHELWWTGPSFLKSSEFCPSSSTGLGLGNLADSGELEDEAVKKELVERVAKVHHSVHDLSILHRYSVWNSVVRFTALVRRYLQNRRLKASGSELLQGEFSPRERMDAELFWIKRVHEDEFAEEFKRLRNIKPGEVGKKVSSSSSLKSLNPFIDKQGILRVGGRLYKASLPDDTKHSILIPQRHHITTLILRHYHQMLLHAGPQLLLATTRYRFWILAGKEATTRFVRRCVECHRHRPTAARQLMGILPANRVTPSPHFRHCGVDYAGPYLIRRNLKDRRAISDKGYVALFVCFATKAIHLELASDGTTTVFINVLKKFISRIGKPAVIYSDCGTNFVGATRELKDFITVTKSSLVVRSMANEGIEWKFNPPSSPHFGGLWEAGVKSFKSHFDRVVKPTHFTIDEMQTLLCQIEACLNSRPLYPASSNPDNLTPLTPGHFLTTQPLIVIPEPDLEDVQETRLSRWQRMQKAVQDIWKRWSSKYLLSLQQRPKGWSTTDNIPIGKLVLLHEGNSSPAVWKLARVIDAHPGPDGLVRVVTLKTKDGTYKRPVVKISALPISDSD